MNTHCTDCCTPLNINPDSCGCCEGVEIVTPKPIYNRPGLSELNYRMGTHASFLETMTARLTGYYLEKPDSDGNLKKYYPLQGLTTRDKSDPSMALLDAWASVGDVMTFYQERIANEGYLRTATERRSILELSRLVGYTPRPGVSSSVFLAYNIDENFKEETIIPVGSRAQSVPGPDELPQAFETSEEITARAEWNNLKPRLSQPQTVVTINSGNEDSAVQGPRVYLKGLSTNLKLNDPLLIDFGGTVPEFFRVREVRPDADADRTLVLLDNASIDDSVNTNIASDFAYLNDMVLPPSIQPRNSRRLRRKLAGQFKNKAASGYKSVASFTPKLKRVLSQAATNAIVSTPSQIKVYLLKAEASLFGHSATREPLYNDNGSLQRQSTWTEWSLDSEAADVLHLDRKYSEIASGQFLVVAKKILDPDTNLIETNYLVKKVNEAETISRNAYGIGAESSKLTLDSTWRTDNEGVFSTIRMTKVYAQPVEMELADEPIETPVCGGGDDLIELDSFYDGLESGRWVIVSGERDLPGTSGVRFSELAMLSEVSQDVGTSIRSDEKLHTFVKLAEKLAYCFKRDTVTIYGNVVKATNGESRHEILGSGNGAQSFQSFELKQFPLTHVSANNPTGIESSLKILVNDVEWHEADSLSGLEANDRKFITKTDNEDKTKIIFGNGIQGSRLPTGKENIRAMYRNGIGKGGNVNAEQISTLSTKPLGVKEVINPLPSSGGANRETRDQARKNTPLAIKALDRLVSVQDYEDFSRVYAGIGKAQAVEISDGRQQLVHVTIAGAEDIPIDESSDLFRNLRSALHSFGDPQQAIQLAVRELMFITLEAGVAILPDYQWESVETKLRETLLDVFGFESRELGQSVMLSEVIKVMQSVRGVSYVDVNAFGGVPEKKALEQADINRLESEHNNKDDSIAFVLPYSRKILSPDDITRRVSEILFVPGFEGEFTSVRRPVAQSLIVQTAAVDKTIVLNKHIQPAQLAFLSPEMPSTLILNQIESTS